MSQDFLSHGSLRGWQTQSRGRQASCCTRPLALRHKMAASPPGITATFQAGKAGCGLQGRGKGGAFARSVRAELPDRAQGPVPPLPVLGIRPGGLTQVKLGLPPPPCQPCPQLHLLVQNLLEGPAQCQGAREETVAWFGARSHPALLGSGWRGAGGGPAPGAQPQACCVQSGAQSCPGSWAIFI